MVEGMYKETAGVDMKRVIYRHNTGLLGDELSEYKNGKI